MNFINGVILVKEVVTFSVLGLCLVGVIILVLTAISLGGIKLHIDGRRSFSDGMKILGMIISIVGIILMISFYGFMNMNNNNFISFADSLGLGLTEHTGEYEVTVTAEADMNEFQEQYEILDYKDGVYTIKLK